jgi:L-lactate dehydrogenase complex protein LldG
MDKAARDVILGRVRTKLGVRGDEITRRGRVHARLAEPPVNVLPERGQKPRADLIKLFQSMLESVGAKVIRVRAQKALGESVAEVLRERNLPLIVRCGTDPLFKPLGDGENSLLEVRRGPAEADDLVSLSHAVMGAAETGTMFLLSGPENPSTLNFLPETHLVAIKADNIMGPYEHAWAKLRGMYGPGRMPRTVNLISGPSRTADIEQTIVMGAHGPRNLTVFILGA